MLSTTAPLVFADDDRTASVVAAAAVPMASPDAVAVVETVLAHAAQQTAAGVQMPPHEAVATVVETVLAHAAAQTVQDTVIAAVLPTVLAAVSSRLSIPQVFDQFRVPLYENDLGTTLAHLERLEEALSLMPQQLGGAPGFYTNTTSDFDVSVGRVWSYAAGTPYEVLNIYDSKSVPLPTPAFVLKCCSVIRKVLTLRLEYLTFKENASKEALTPGIADWDFHEGCIPETLINNTLETTMFEETSQVLDREVDPDEWKAAYAPTLCPSPEELFKEAYIPGTRLRLLRDRDVYLECAMALCMAAETSIQISTCYFFGNDPAQRYIMLDLLPYCIRQRGITVHLLLDLMTMESAFVKSGFQNKDVSTTIKQDRTGRITSTSFLNYRPSDAPDFTQSEALTTMTFLQKVCETARSFGDKFQVRWWCARDAEHKYRVKNHSKGIVADRKVAIIGGSNLCPQLNAATTEVDCCVAGDVVDQIYASTRALWNASGCFMTENSRDLPSAEPYLSGRLFEFVAKQTWDDDDCKAAIVRSQPSFKGEDAILRVVLGAIHGAKSSVTMCFGHSAYPIVVNEAIAQATKRGVRCKMLFNSHFSNDLRGGQRDMFLSLRHLLTVAPNAEVHVTAPIDGHLPPFVHAKYMVVDNQWSACGSFNLWPRASFYEIEHEAIVESELIAKTFEAKFDRDRSAHTIRLLAPEDVDEFLPTRCTICEVFGPFFEMTRD